jgi:hypothetical protein
MDYYEDFYNSIVAAYKEFEGDIEYQHLEADKLMWAKLRELGYGKAMDYLEKQEKWFA